MKQSDIDALYVHRDISTRSIVSDGNVTVPKETMDSLVRLAFEGRLEEEWYKRSNEDVDDAIAKGIFDRGLDHYATLGVYEQRMPFQVPIDEEAYMASYPDISKALSNKEIGSASEHFHSIGFSEGRYFQLASGAIEEI